MLCDNHIPDRSPPVPALSERIHADGVVIRFLEASALYFNMPRESAATSDQHPE
jgi:hypothetical protein